MPLKKENEIQLEADLDPEILDIFIEEAREELVVLEEYFPSWRNNNQDTDALTRIRRSFHTLKGSGRMVGANSIGEFAWSVEKLFNQIIDNVIPISEKITQAIEQSIHILPDFVNALEKGEVLKYNYISLQEANFALAEGQDVDLASLTTTQESDSTSVEEIPLETTTPSASAVSISLEEDLDPEILDIFIEEATEEIPVLNEYFPHWLNNINDTNALAIIRRSFHTLKGSGRMVGANMIGEFAWSVEKLFNQIIDQKITVNKSVQKALTESVAIIPDFVNALEHQTPLPFNYFPLQEANFALAEGQDIEIPSVRSTDTVLKEDKEDKEEIVETLNIQSEITEEIEEEVKLFSDAVVPPESVIMPLDEDLDPEILDIFIEEAKEEIAVLDEYFPHWIENTDDKEALTVIRRSFHTLKGSGRMVGANIVGEFAWSVEKLFNQIIDEKVTITNQVKKALTESVAIIPDFVNALEQNKPLNFNYLLLQEANFDLIEGKTVDVPTLSSTTAIKNEETTSEVNPISNDISSLFDEVEEAKTEFTELGTEKLAFEEEADLQESQLRDSDFDESNDKENEFVEEHFGVEMDTVLYDIFLSESLSHIKTIKDFIQSCQQCHVEDEICRAFHTLRGSAHMAEVPSIAELAGSVEHYLNSLNAQNSEISDEVRDLIGECIANIEENVLAIGANKEISDSWIALSNRINLYHEEYINHSVENAEKPEEVQTEESAIDPEMVEIFLEEAADLLDALDDSLQQWLAEPTDSSHIDSMKRTLHTLKGGARLSGITDLGNLSHEFETLLTDIADKKIKITEDVTTLSQDIGDGIADLVDQVAMSQVPTVSKELVTRLHRMLDEDEDDSSLLTSSDLEPNSLLQDDSSIPSKLLDLQEHTQDSAITSDTGLSDLQGSKLSFTEKNKNKSEKAKTTADSGEKVRVSADLLNKLVNLSGEVSIYRARLEQQNTTLQFNLAELGQTVTRLRRQLRTLEIETEAQILFRHEREGENEEKEGHEDFDPLEMDRFSTMQQVSRSLAETVSDLASIRDLLEDESKEADILLLQQFRVSTELQDGLLQTRMVPFNQVVARLSRLVRQTAKSLKKESNLEVIGQDTEIDRGILQRIVGPLEHLLRNGVSHGIELPAERKAKGKKLKGKITISLSREGRDILIAVGDDGGGLNRDKILKKAIEKKMVDNPASLTDEDIYQFIAKPGFSTVEQLDQISGRGVGMDVVFSGIKELGGTVEIQSELGIGSNFIIRLPLTLSITDALLVTVSEERYAILHTSIEGVVRISQEQMIQAQNNEEDAIYEYVGQEYNIRPLANMLGLPSKGQSQSTKWVPALLVKAGRRRVALQVDGLLGSRQVVVKPVGIQIATVPWISGGSILGDGGVALLLDVNALIHSDLTNRDIVKEVEEVKTTTIMVVDDSITVRKVTARVLERYELNVITAKDGLDALDVLEGLQDNMPDAMLLDIEMPRMDGFELAKRIMSNDLYKQIPIIMITSRTGDKHRNRAFDIGVKRYLGKPFQESDLMDNIRSVLEESGK